MITGQNASVFSKFVLTNVLLMRLNEGISNTISKKNVLLKKLHVNFPLLVAKSMQKHLYEANDEHLKITVMECKTLETKSTDLTLAFAKFAPQVCVQSIT